MNPNLTLMPFQEEGAELLARTPRAMLAWDAGIGKTPTAVRACVKFKAGTIIVFCPPIATSVWRQHFEDWSDYDVRVQDHPPGFGFEPWDGSVFIVPYSRAGAYGFAYPWDVVILDEAHYLKNAGAQRTRAVYGPKLNTTNSPCQFASRVWCLTGTPLLNNPSEFWTHLHALAPVLIAVPGHGVMTEHFFTHRFCVVHNTVYGPKILGNRNSEELRKRIVSFVHRKRIKDVILDLPDLRIVEHPLPESTDIPDGLRDTMKRLLNSTSGLNDEELLAELQSGAVAFAAVRHLIGLAKTDGVCALANDILCDDQESKLIIFAHHRDVVAKLAGDLQYYKPLVIHGGTPQKSRDDAIFAFQNDLTHRLIILAIDAASESITLTAARNVIIAEPSPVPARNHQAIARAHRRGQKNPVVARFVLLPGTLDETLMRIIARKTRDISKIVDPRTTVMDDLKDLLNQPIIED